VSTLVDHIGKVDTLTEEVARYRGLRWSNPQPLRKNTHEVGDTRTMPQKHVVTDFLVKVLFVRLALNLEDGIDIYLPAFLGVVQIVRQQLVLF